MKKIFFPFLFSLFLIISCDQEDNYQEYDVNTTSSSLIQFNEEPRQNILVNPENDITTVVEIGISNVSDQDRTFNIAVDDTETTLSTNKYSISNQIIIPAGEYVGSTVLTVFADTNFTPETLKIDLVDFEGQTDNDVLQNPDTVTFITLEFCEFEVSDLTGTWSIVTDAFDTCIADCTFEMVPGPGENQVTALDIFDHQNPDTGGTYDVIFDVVDEFGNLSVDTQPAWHCDNFGCDFGEGRIEGLGSFVNCDTPTITATFEHTVDAGTFGDYNIIMEKQ